MGDGHITVMGTPAAAGFCAGLWAAAGHAVTWVAPPQLREVFLRDGLHLTDRSGLDARMGADTLACVAGKAALSKAAMIVVFDATPEALDLLVAAEAEGALRETVILHLQSVTSSNDMLAAQLGQSGRLPVLPGVLPWSVAQRQDAGLHLHREGRGPLVVTAEAAALSRDLDVPCLEVKARRDIAGLLWGRRLPDLARVCARLSGTAPAQLLRDPKWRGVVADQWQEALMVLRAAGIHPRPARGLPLALRVRLLRARRVPPELACRLGWPEVFGAASSPTAAATPLSPLLALGQRLGVAMPVNAALAQTLAETLAQTPAETLAERLDDASPDA